MIGIENFVNSMLYSERHSEMGRGRLIERQKIDNQKIERRKIERRKIECHKIERRFTDTQYGNYRK